MNLYYTDKRKKRVKLIFNPASGANRQSPVKLMEIIKAMQAWKFVPEPYLTERDSDMASVVQDAISQGYRMLVVCGGDGTVSAVARAMIGKTATLGIIPTGTQNNVALSLGIPSDISAAIAVLRTGKRIKTDMGLASCGTVIMPFLEVCSVGLFSALFDSGDELQHGNISSIGNFISTLTTSPPSEIRLLLDDNKETKYTGYMTVISNMPYFGRHIQVGSDKSFNDGLFEVLFCPDISKLDLVIGYLRKVPGINTDPDQRFKILQVRKAVIGTEPPMPVMADGISLGEGSVSIEMLRHVLAVIVPEKANKASEKISEKVSNKVSKKGESLEKK